MNKWMSILLNSKILQNVLGKKRNNSGMIWATLLGIGASAAAFGINRNRTKNMKKPLENVMNPMRNSFNGQIPNAVLAEFAKELGPDKNSLTNK